MRHHGQPVRTKSHPPHPMSKEPIASLSSIFSLSLSTNHWHWRRISAGSRLFARFKGVLLGNLSKLKLQNNKSPMQNITLYLYRQHIPRSNNLNVDSPRLNMVCYFTLQIQFCVINPLNLYSQNASRKSESLVNTVP